ncbi:MAG: hypothetical protein ACO1NW_11255 [Chitinophagaceae bacterium]
MFLSKHHLTGNFAVAPEIAAFYVDRKVPENNLYWKGKLLYLRHNPGYLFIPLFCDVLYRVGVPLEQLISDPFVALFEAVLHSAAREEFGETDEKTHLTHCYQLAEGHGGNGKWLRMMEEHFVQHTATLPYQPEALALRRADAFLFALNALHIPEGKEELVCQYWYALISFFLLMDDIDDYAKDKRGNDQNTLLEWGDGKDAVEKVSHLLEEDIKVLNEINPKLSAYCTDLVEKFEITGKLAAIAAS